MDGKSVDNVRGELSRRQGSWGERMAALFLKQNGWEIIDRNVRPCERDRRCEIDLIASHAGGIAFVEVKTHATRSSAAYRLAGVNARKKRVLLRACANWVMKNRWHGNFRFDVIEVYGWADSPMPPEIDHIENVPLFPPKWRFW